MEDNPTWSNLPLRAGPIPAASVPATTISRSSRLSNRGTGPGTVGRDHTGRDRHTDGSGHRTGRPLARFLWCRSFSSGPRPEPAVPVSRQRALQ